MHLKEELDRVPEMPKGVGDKSVKVGWEARQRNPPKYYGMGGALHLISVPSKYLLI
jgi:hypothetical protein